MSDHVITIKKEHIIENTINKSRFIAHIKPVFSEEEAKMFIEEVKQTHKEATHNCSAYTVGNQMNIQKPTMMENQQEQQVFLCLKY